MYVSIYRFFTLFRFFLDVVICNMMKLSKQRPVSKNKMVWNGSEMHRQAESSATDMTHKTAIPYLSFPCNCKLMLELHKTMKFCCHHHLNASRVCVVACFFFWVFLSLSLYLIHSSVTLLYFAVYLMQICWHSMFSVIITTRINWILWTVTWHWFALHY